MGVGFDYPVTWNYETHLIAIALYPLIRTQDTDNTGILVGFETRDGTTARGKAVEMLDDAQKRTTTEPAELFKLEEASIGTFKGFHLGYKNKTMFSRFIRFRLQPRWDMLSHLATLGRRAS